MTFAESQADVTREVPISRALVDPSVEASLRDYLADGEILQWAQPSMARPARERVWKRITEVFWLVMMATIIVYGGSTLFGWIESNSWPSIEVLLGLVCLAIGVPVFALTLKSFFTPSDDGQIVFAISDRRVLSLNVRTQERTSLVGVGRYRASVSVEKTTSNLGSLTIWCDEADDDFYLEMRSVREVDAAERLIIASFGRSEQEEKNEQTR